MNLKMDPFPFTVHSYTVRTIQITSYHAGLPARQLTGAVGEEIMEMFKEAKYFAQPDVSVGWPNGTWKKAMHST